MPGKELIDFLKQARKLKLNLESIGRELVKAGWSIEDVDEAMKAVKPLKVPMAPLKAPKAEEKKKEEPAKEKEPEKKKEEKEEEKEEEEELRAPKAPATLAKKSEKPAQAKPSGAETLAIEHIKKLRESGMTDDQIKEAFIEKGWKPEVADKLIKKAKE